MGTKSCCSIERLPVQYPNRCTHVRFVYFLNQNRKIHHYQKNKPENIHMYFNYLFLTLSTNVHYNYNFIHAENRL
jgi:hypothetical protein